MKYKLDFTYQIKRLFLLFIAFIITLVFVQGISYQDVYAETIEKEQIINDFDTEGEINVVTYSQEWSSSVNSSDQHNQDEHWINNTGWSEGEEPYYIITFEGTKLQLYGNKSPNLGEYRISIDGVKIETVLATAPTRLTGQLIYETPVLEQGKHTIKVQGIYNSKNMQFDYAKVYYQELTPPVGSLAIEGDQLINGEDNTIVLRFQDLPLESKYLAAKVNLLYDATVLSFKSVSVNKSDATVKATVHDGKLKIGLSARSGLESDLRINVTMSTIKPVKSTTITSQAVEVSNGSGEISNLSNGTVVLVSKTTVNKQILEIAVEEANKITEAELSNVIPIVGEEFRAALLEAKNILSDTNATQEQVNVSFGRISKVMHYLSFTKGDKKDLIRLIAKINKLEQEEYFPDPWNNMQLVLISALEVVADQNALQPDVIKAHEDLIKAFLQLRLKPNKELLADLIKQANEFKMGLYTSKSWDALVQSLSDAKAVFDNENATLAQIKEAEIKLSLAIASLVPNIQTQDKSVKVKAKKTGDSTSMLGLLGLGGSLSVLLIIGLKKKK